jgi:hypothetical protein
VGSRESAGHNRNVDNFAHDKEWEPAISDALDAAGLLSEPILIRVGPRQAAT